MKQVSLTQCWCHRAKTLDERAQESLAKLDAGDLATKRARDVREFASKMIRVGSNATISAQTNGAVSHTYG